MHIINQPLLKMATLSLHSPTFFLLSLLLVIFILRQHLAVAGGCQYPPVIFNFGDSNSDTGGLAAGLGYTIGLSNGRSFFRRSTGRLSDGRLIIDFLCKLTSLCSCLTHVTMRRLRLEVVESCDAHRQMKPVKS